MKLEPVAWIDPYATNYIVGDEAVMMSATSKKHAKFTAPLYAIPDGYVVVPVEQAKDAERLDYLQHNARCDPKMDGNHIWWPTSLNQAHRLTGSSLRTAIDKAMIAAIQRHIQE